MKKIMKRYRYSAILLKQLVITDFKIRYKGSVLGYLWTLLKPLALFSVLYIVFVRFLRFGDAIPHFAVYLLLGLVIWNYFVEVTMNGLSAIVGKGDLIRKLFFPRYVVVVSGSFSALINVLINLFVVFIFATFSGVDFGFSALLIFPLLLELFVFALAVAFLLSVLYVRFRDVNYIWEVVLQAGFYATPIIYPIAMVTAMAPIAAKLMLLNPIAQIIQDARWAIITKETQTALGLYGSITPYIITIGLVIAITITSVFYFKKRSPYFAEEV